MSWSRRFISASLATGAMLAAAAAPAEAWPIPLTPDQIQFLNAARGNFPGDDDQLLLVGEQMCHLLYSGQSSASVIDTTAGQYGASPDQTAVVMRAARRTLCTQAPG
jgi:hypothetical protein